MISRWINTKQDLKQLAKTLGVRDDWHEPDEQDVDCKLVNKKFDNAFCDDSEAHVILNAPGESVAINVANLLAWACK